MTRPSIPKLKPKDGGRAIAIKQHYSHVLISYAVLIVNHARLSQVSLQALIRPFEPV